MHKDTGAAARIKEAVRLKGFTYERLAMEANVSLSLVKKVLTYKAAASPAFIAGCAKALKMSPTDFYDRPDIQGIPGELKLHEGIPGMRREFAAYSLEPTIDGDPRPFDALRTDVTRATKLRHSVKFDELGELLPNLLRDLRTAWTVEPVPAQKERLFGLAAETYYAASQFAYKLGYVDLASIAVERYEWAAGQSGDELAVLAGRYQRAGELLATADWDTALDYMEQSLASVERVADLGTDVPTMAMAGNLHLKRGLVAARAGKADLVTDHLAEARTIAARIGTDRDDYTLCFGPTNVNIWSVGLMVEQMNGTEAIKRAQGMTFPTGTPKERVGHHYIDLSRAFLLHGNHQKALQALVTAKQVAPVQTRYHPTVHETLRALARREARSSETVRGLAAWCGVN